MKKRLGSRSSGGFLFVERPFFDVQVQLSVPHVTMNPALNDIQAAINSTAKKVSYSIFCGTLTLEISNAVKAEWHVEDMSRI